MFTLIARALLAAALSLSLASAALSQARSGIITSYSNSSVRPADDLFRHVNGKWLNEAKIPADRAADGALMMLREKSEDALRAIIESAAKVDQTPGSGAQKIADLFASYMDESRIELLGAKPIEPDLREIDAISDKSGLIRKLNELQAVDPVLGPQSVHAGLFALRVWPDAKQSDRTIIYVVQGGLSLPDESYYREPKFEPIRKAFVTHVGKMLSLVNTPHAEAAAESVMNLETRLAASHWDRVTNRDVSKIYNKLDAGALAALTPGFSWSGWASDIKAPEIDQLVVYQPSYFTGMAKALDEVPLDTWKTYLRWRLVHSLAPLLSQPFVDEDFAFFEKTFAGTPELKPRWKRAVAAVELALGEAAGELYVAEHFPPLAKERMKVLIANLIEAYRGRIATLEWMSPQTRAKALEKLAKFTPKVGYPETWRDYSQLEIKRDDLVGNMRRAVVFERNRHFAKLGKPVDRSEWALTPQTVNASYFPLQNEIVFTAAILQPPCFALDADDAVNYGGIGAVIGHEIGHGFDDQGSKFDGDGNLNNWWTDADRGEFEKRAKMLIDQYSAFEPVQLPGQKVNGALTVGENIGDLGGVTIAFEAYTISLKGSPAPMLEGLTGPQRFFTGWAQVWRAKMRDEELQNRLATNTHSPAEFRCNVVRNLSQFYAAFGVKEGDKLWLPPEKRVRIW